MDDRESDSAILICDNSVSFKL